ncbi:hypothetical protein KM043_002295 [Ampulex compressa]|nr:hypothetical protein KM043_002295 [Ampulex compressa]
MGKRGWKGVVARGRASEEGRSGGASVVEEEGGGEAGRWKRCLVGGRWEEKRKRARTKERQRERKNAFGLLDRVGGHVRRLGCTGGSPGHGLAGQPVADSDERQLCLYYRTPSRTYNPQRRATVGICLSRAYVSTRAYL